jgi:hypothetical protein
VAKFFFLVRVNILNFLFFTLYFLFFRFYIYIYIVKGSILSKKNEILSHFKKHIIQTEIEIFYLDFVDEFYPVENKVQTVTKEERVKEDNTVVS